MDPTTLVNDLIEEGGRIAEQLPHEGFEVATAFWLKASTDGQWYFYIVSPLAESDRLADGYGRLHMLMRQMAPPRRIDPLEVRLIGPSNPIARDVFAIHHQARAPKAAPFRWGGRQLGNVDVEDAYLYPLHAPASQ